MQPGAPLIFGLVLQQTRQRPHRHNQAKGDEYEGTKQRWANKITVIELLGRPDQGKSRPNDQGTTKRKREQRQKVLAEKQRLRKQDFSLKVGAHLPDVTGVLRLALARHKWDTGWKLRLPPRITPVPHGTVAVTSALPHLTASTSSQREWLHLV